MLSLPVAGAVRLKCLSKLIYANQLLDLPFLAVTRNERQEYVIRHFFLLLQNYQSMKLVGHSHEEEKECGGGGVSQNIRKQLHNPRGGS